jgi:hypothetical protein
MVRLTLARKIATQATAAACQLQKPINVVATQ